MVGTIHEASEEHAVFHLKHVTCLVRQDLTAPPPQDCLVVLARLSPWKVGAYRAKLKTSTRSKERQGNSMKDRVGFIAGDRSHERIVETLLEKRDIS
jgi:hypothetical protein